MKNLIRLSCILSLVAIFLHSCTDNYFEFDKIKTDEWRPELALPLINSSLTLEDVLITKDSSGNVGTNSDGILEVVYEGRVFSTNSNQAINLPQQDFNEQIEFPGGIPPSPTAISLPFNTDFTIGFEDTTNSGLEIDNILLKDGDIVLTIENRYQHRILLKATYKTFTDANGDTLVLNYDVPPAQAGGISVRSIITDLTGYNLKMNEDVNGNPAVNKIPIDLEFTFELTPNIGSSPGERLNVKGSLRNLDFKEFTGDAGSNPLELDKDTILIALFSNFKNGTFFLSNPMLDITIFNSYAVPMSLFFQELKALNDEATPQEKFIQLPQNPIALNSPLKYGVEDTTISLNSTVSNIDEIISYLVKQISYDAVANLNPNGRPAANQRNFITDTSSIAIDVDLRLPFQGRASGFNLVDTVDFEFDISDELDNGLVRVIAENGFPIDAQFQIVFLDSLYNPIDSLYNNGLTSLVPSSIVNSAGETVSRSRKLTDVELTSARLRKLSDGKFALLKAELNTSGASNSQNVKFKPEYRLDISVGLKASILIN